MRFFLLHGSVIPAVSAMETMSRRTYDELRAISYQCLLDLTTEEGINASGKDEIYGCIFGRDTAITVLKILQVLKRNTHFSENERFILQTMCRKALLTLVTLQGTEHTLESGEEPGKFIHEYRKDKYQHLLALPTPWYVYPDGILRNYDSIDATPLGLIALYRFWELTGDSTFLLTVLPAVEKALNWIITYGDKDKDTFLEYEFSKQRTYGGLVVQSWTDSHESLRQANGTLPIYPIAPVEAQGYAWLALKLWADFYRETDMHLYQAAKFAQKMANHADLMKEWFNKQFLFKEYDLYYAAQALDGNKQQIQTITGNPLLLLWASYKKHGQVTAILEDTYISAIVKRAFQKDMFDEEAGIRTMSTAATTYNPNQNSYHNGSFWPKLNGMSYEGLLNWGFEEDARMLRHASLKPLLYFGSPIELYIKGEDGEYLEFVSPSGQRSCRNQAWSAATALDILTTEDLQ